MTLALCKKCHDAMPPIMLLLTALDKGGAELESAIQEFRKFKLCAECQKRSDRMLATRNAA